MADRNEYKRLHAEFAAKPDVLESPELTWKTELEDITEIAVSHGSNIVIATARHERSPPPPPPPPPPSKPLENRENAQNQHFRPSLKRFGQYAVVLRRFIDGPLTKSVKLEIQSPTLQAEFRKLAKGCGDEFEVQNDCIAIPSPFKVLFHAREKIKQYQANPHPCEKKEEMKLLEDFIETNSILTRTVSEYNQLMKMRKITVDLLWTIFNIGDLVLYDLHGETEYWRLLKLRTSTVNDSYGSWSVSGIVMGYDGHRIGEVEIRRDLTSKRGEIDISRLPITPAKFIDGEDKIREMAIKRGKMWARLVKAKHLFYDGALSDNPEHRPGSSFKGRVVVDYESFIREQGGKGASLLPSRSQQIQLTDEEYLLFPSRIPGFIFRQKRWAFFDMHGPQEIKWNEETYARLEMDKERKELVRALVVGHNSESEEDMFDDIVEKKGRGLIFLLAGPPGLGKTLLAESISELTKRPLYAISCAEVSNDPVKMEQKLQKIFRLGRAWNAIVLLDEADVLMSKRESGSIQHNSVSTVFLRILEYYEGILFLTTNRAEDFDDAILDRVHVTLNFKSLEPHVRQRIWRMLIEANSQLEISTHQWTDEVYAALAAFKTNGRTIKNLLRTAYAYAKSEKCPLKPRHVKAVVKVNLVEREGMTKHEESWKGLEKLLEGELGA